MIDPVIHPINRFKIAAYLNAQGAVADEDNYQVRFSTLRDAVGISDATLSKQLTALEDAGYVYRAREYGSTRAKDVVWIALTSKGKKAFDAHVATLRSIASGDA